VLSRLNEDGALRPEPPAAATAEPSTPPE
jgi:hypothetical protein